MKALLTDTQISYTQTIFSNSDITSSNISDAVN